MVHCKKGDCYYARPISGSKGGPTACHYMLMTGEVRGCPGAQCDKYMPRLEARRLGMKYREG